VYYSLTYVGFLLPAALAALTSFAPMWILLAATAVACALCTALAARGMRRSIVDAAPRSPELNRQK
jgi:hypothetical protein